MQKPNIDENGEGKQVLAMRAAAGDGWQKGAAAGEDRVDYCTTLLGADKSRQQQMAAPIVMAVGVNASILLLRRGRCGKHCSHTKRKRLSNGRRQRLTRRAPRTRNPAT